MNDMLNYYDWLLTSQLLLVVGVFVLVLFYRRLRNYNEVLVSIPFSLCLSISIFTSQNLISFIFFTEIIFNLSNILYEKKYKQYSSKHYENVRYFFWIVLVFCYYHSFSTFSFDSVPKVASAELVFVVVLLLSIVYIQLLLPLLRQDNSQITLKEIIGYDIFSILTFSLKSLYIVSSITDSLEPQHHKIIDIMILIFIGSGSFLAFRFLKTKSISKITSIVRSLVILSLFPILGFSNNSFWDDFSVFSSMLILSFLILEIVGKYGKVGRSKGVAIFLLLCLVTGLNPFGYFHSILKNTGDHDAQVSLLLGLSMCAISLCLNAKRLFELSMNKQAS